MQIALRAGEAWFHVVGEFCVLGGFTQAGLVCSTKKSGQLYQVGKVDCREMQLRSVVIQLQKENENVKRQKNNN